jgi:hypothetical protein
MAELFAALAMLLLPYALIAMAVAPTAPHATVKGYALGAKALGGTTPQVRSVRHASVLG